MNNKIYLLVSFFMCYAYILDNTVQSSAKSSICEYRPDPDLTEFGLGVTDILERAIVSKGL